MAKRNLLTNIDSTQPDSTTNPTVAAHQRDHDVIHAGINLLFDTTAPTDGQLLRYSTATGTYVPVTLAMILNPAGSQGRLWLRAAGQVLPTVGEGARDGDYALADGGVWRRSGGVWAQTGTGGGSGTSNAAADQTAISTDTPLYAAGANSVSTNPTISAL